MRSKADAVFGRPLTSTLDRYVLREITKPLLIFCPALFFLYANFAAIRYLDRVSDGLMSADAVLPLVLLKAAIALEILVPIGLHVSAVVALGRLYTDSEMTAFFACGISPMRIFRAVILLSLVVAGLVACLSLVVRPWANDLRYRLQRGAVVDFDLDNMKPGHFYESATGNRVMFFKALDRDSGFMQGLFLQTRSGDAVQVLSAEVAYYQKVDDPRTKGFLVCFQVRIYEISRSYDDIVQTVSNKLTLNLEKPDDVSIGYKRKAAPTWQLARSDASLDIAELQWRLSTPVSAFLMGLLSFPLSRARPRQGKYAKLFISVLSYTAFYNLLLMARTWVEQGVVGSIPGVWWPHLLLALLIVGLMWRWPGSAR